MAAIRPFTSEYDEYLKDESRSVGEAQTVSFPTDEEQVRAILRQLHENATPVTVQGGRTGLAAGAVPHGGHVLNLSKMNHCLGMRVQDADAASEPSAAENPAGQPAFFVSVQPGVVLSQLRKDLEDKNMATTGWDAQSLAAWKRFCDAPE